MCATAEERAKYSPFKKAICSFLARKAEEEPVFKTKLKDPTKSIDKCIDYIIGEIIESGRQGFADCEIYSLALHYYDEPNETLKEHKHIDNVKVVVNREMSFTEEEKKKAREQAYKELVEENKRKLKGTPVKTDKKENNSTDGEKQLSLF